jgi:hypothetical protein
MTNNQAARTTRLQREERAVLTGRSGWDDPSSGASFSSVQSPGAPRSFFDYDVTEAGMDGDNWPVVDHNDWFQPRRSLSMGRWLGVVGLIFSAWVALAAAAIVVNRIVELWQAGWFA